MTRAHNLALPVFLAVASLVLVASTWIVRSSMFAEHPEILARAVSLDIAVLIPGLYVLIARARGWPWITALPVFLLSLVAAHAVLPSQHAGWLRALELLAVPAELFAVVYLFRKVRRVSERYRVARRGTQDFVEAAETVLAEAGVGRRLAGIALTESSVLHYGFFAWGRRPSNQGPALTFSYHTANGYGVLVGSFIFLILLETTLVHLAVATRSAGLAWVLSGLGAYGILFVIADFNAARQRPLLLDPHALHVRTAFRWRAAVPLAAIANVEVASVEIEDKRSLLKAVLIGDHNLVIELRRPLVAHGVYGFSKTFDRIALAVDDPHGFASALRARLNE